jgi:hypothetical protein
MQEGPTKKRAPFTRPERGMRSFWVIFSLVLFAVVSVLVGKGCTEKEGISLSIPKGWDGNSTYWWQIEADTTNAFRPLETMAEMGISGSHLLSATLDGAAKVDRDLAQLKFNQYVKESLIELFRNEPKIVDSLFNRYVVPKMEGVNLAGDVQPQIKTFQREAYRIIARHFRYPRAITKLGVDIPVPVPDSLQNANISGSVLIQLALNKEGVPIALQRLNGVHPTLDRIAMQAMTQMRWQPAYLLKGGKSVPVPSWTRMKVNFGSTN